MAPPRKYNSIRRMALSAVTMSMQRGKAPRLVVSLDGTRVYVTDTIRASLTGYPGSYLFELDASTLTPFRSLKLPGSAIYLAYAALGAFSVTNSRL